MYPEIWFPSLGIKIEHLDRVAFNVMGKLPIYWYGVIMVFSILVASVYVVLETKRTGQDTDAYYDMAVFGIAGALIGARAYYVIFSWESYKDNLLKIFAFREGGLALYGSVIGGVLALFIYTRIKKLNFLLFTDTIAPAYLLAQAIGRWGNFINREAFGSYTDNIFAMRYLASTVPYIPASVLERIVFVDWAAYIQVHPTFLYESAWNLFGFFILLLLKNKKKFDGQITALYFIVYGAGRIWIEGMRTDQLLIGTTNIAISQVLSGVFIILAIVYLLYGGRRYAALAEAGEMSAEVGEQLEIAETEEGAVADETEETVAPPETAKTAEGLGAEEPDGERPLENKEF